MFLYTAASLFIEETLHKSRRDSATSSQTTETPSSTDSGIELARQLQEDDKEPDDKLLAPDTPLVMESDIDSEPDDGMTSFDEGITSDTELLIDTREGEERGRWRGRLRRWSASWSPQVVVRNTQSKARGWRESCGGCVTSCVSCTPRKAWQLLRNKLRLMLHKLLAVARLMGDRKVFLSTSIYGIFGGLHILLSEVGHIPYCLMPYQ